MNHFLWLFYNNFAFCQWYRQWAWFFLKQFFHLKVLYLFTKHNNICTKNSCSTSIIPLQQIHVYYAVPIEFWILFPVCMPRFLAIDLVNICCFLLIFFSTEYSKFEALLLYKVLNALCSSVLTEVWTARVVRLLLAGISAAVLVYIFQLLYFLFLFRAFNLACCLYFIFDTYIPLLAVVYDIKDSKILINL